MAEGRRRDEWERLSFLRADIRSLFSQEPVNAMDFDPYKCQRARKANLRISSVDDLAALFGVPIT